MKFAVNKWLNFDDPGMTVSSLRCLMLLSLFFLLPTMAFLTLSSYEAVIDSFDVDDAYYYLVIAQNMLDGHGSTADGITQTNGYQPLWQGVCVLIEAAARGAGISAPRLSMMLCSILLCVALWQLFLLALDCGLHEGIALSIVLCMGVSPAFLGVMLPGMEAAINLLMIVLFLRAGHKGDGWLGALWGSLAFLARIDNLILILAFGPRRKKTLRVGLSTAALYFIANWLVFGYPMPVSGAIKALWADVWNESDKAISAYAFAVAYLAFPAVCVLAMWVVSAMKQIQPPALVMRLFLACSVHLFAYWHHVDFVEAREWYWCMEYVLMALALAYALPAAAGLPWLRNGIALAAFSLYLVFSSVHCMEKFSGKDLIHPSDHPDIKMLQKYFTSDDVIGMVNSGHEMYHSDFKIVNVDGLVNSYEYFQALKEKNAPEYLKSIGVDYVFLYQVEFVKQPYEANFRGGRFTLYADEQMASAILKDP